MHRRSLTLALLGALAGGCGGGGGSAPPEVAVRYEIRLLGPPARGVQVGRPFSVRVEFTEVGTDDPVAVPAEDPQTIAIASGAGTLGGTTAVAGGGTSASFDALVLDATGRFELVVEGPGAAAPATTGVFEVGQRFDLAFRVLPPVAYVEQPFAAEVVVVEPGSGAVVDPGYPVGVEVAVDGGGTATGTVAGGAPASIGGLVVTAPAATSTRLVARAFGFPDATSATITVDRLTVEGLALFGSTVVGGPFRLAGTVVGATSRRPVAPDPPLRITVSAGAASGTLSGSRVADTAGSSIDIGPLRWDTAGDVSLALTAPGLDPVALLARFGYALRAEVQGPTTALPNEPLGPIAFRLEDAAGVPFGGAADPLAWTIARVADGAVVATGSAPFAGGIASIAPGGLAEAGSYRLVGTAGAVPVIDGGASEVPLEIAFTLADAPGPFVPLRSVRVGTPYADSVAWAALPGTVAQAPRFGLLRGELPAGLALDQTTGELAGTPSLAGAHEFVLWARQSATELQPLRCALAVFAADESDVAAQPPDFGSPGPLAGQATVVDDVFSFTSSFDGQAYSTALRLWLPPVAPAPLVVLHRNRDVDHVDYAGLATHLAGWGIACASVEDYQSFRDASGRAPDPVYDMVVIEAGIESGAAFVEAVIARLAARAAEPGDPLQNAIDPERVIVAGHGRGGGSAHAAHHRYLANKARGFVYLMALDLRLSPYTEPPGDPRGTAMYPIATGQPRLPQLVVSAGNDGDIFYPIADQLADRASGPSTFVTIYGGVSCFATDQRTYDENLATITRAAQQPEVFRYVTAFVKRWAEDDRSLDRLLYGDLAAGSTRVGVFAERALAEKILVDDFQDLDPARNALGGSNSLSAGSRAELSVYPPFGGFASLGIRHSIVYLSAVGSAVYTAEFPALDVRRARRVAFRIGQTTAAGFDWVTVRVRLRDGAGASAVVTVWDHVQQAGALPDFEPSSPDAYDRFVGVELPLAAFTGVDPADLRSLEILFETDGAVAIERQICFDDLRFE